jgi:hypothetical protein
LTVIRVQGRADGVERVAHALAALRHRLVGQADDREIVLATGNSRLDLDRTGLDPDKGERSDTAVHGDPHS